MKKAYWHVYVNDHFVETVYSGWPMMRLFAHIRRKYADAKCLELRRHDDDACAWLGVSK